MMRSFSRVGALRPLQGLRGASAQLRQLHGSVPLKQQKEEAPLGPSLLEKYQLDEPTRFVPLTVAGFGLATMTGLYHVDAETQLLGLWVMLCGTVYSQAGPIIAETLDEMAEAIRKEHNEAEDAEIAAVKATIAAHERKVNIYDDIALMAEQQKLAQDAIAETATLKLQHALRAAYVRKLDAIVQAETKASEDTRALLIEGATKYVKNAYLSGADSSLKTSALDAALSALANPEGAKKDQTVGKLYSKYFQEFNNNLAKAKGTTVELTKEDVAEMQEAVEGLARRENMDLGGFKVESKVVV